MKSLTSILTLALVVLLILPCTVSAGSSQKVPYTQILDSPILSEGYYPLNAEETENLIQKLQNNNPKKYCIANFDLSTLYNNNWKTTALINNTPIEISFEYEKQWSQTRGPMHIIYDIYKTDPITNEKTYIGYADISTNIEDSQMSLWTSFKINNKNIRLDSISQPQKGKWLCLLTEFE